MNKRTRRRLVAGSLIAVTLVSLGAATAWANHTPCVGGITQPVGPHGTSAGIKAVNGSASVCVDVINTTLPTPLNRTTAGANITVTIIDPNTASLGTTARADVCTTDTVGTSEPPPPTCQPIEQTGAETGTITQTPDAPGGGTAGGQATSSGTCIYANGSDVPSGCGSVVLAQAVVAEGDLPRMQHGSSCLGDIPGGGPCEVSSFQIEVGNDTSRTTINATIAGTPVSHNVARDCVAGVGQACTF